MAMSNKQMWRRSRESIHIRRFIVLSVYLFLRVIKNYKTRLMRVVATKKTAKCCINENFFRAAMQVSFGPLAGAGKHTSASLTFLVAFFYC